MAYDLIIRGGTIADGKGSPLFEGDVATIVSGQVVYREGEATGALPGRLVRGAQAGP